MHHDGGFTLGQIHDSETDLLETVIDIQSHHTVSRKSCWGHNLRFIQLPGQRVQECPSCRVSCSNITVLRLTEPTEHPEVTNYVCVSYCWESSYDKSNESDIRFHVITANGCRSNRARSSVLRRAVAYATQREVALIWIDQECIEQNDSLEKELGIQSMDTVYQRSEYPLALIDTPIVCQEELNFFLALLACPSFDRMELVMHVQKVLGSGDFDAMLGYFERFVSDPVWSRAWIFQEQGISKDRMIMLIPHQAGLLKTVVVETYEGELVIPFLKLLSWPVGVAIAVKHRAAASQPMAEAVNAALTNRILVEFYEADPETFWNKMSRQTACNLWSQINKRGISVVSDKLAILANTCRYQRRINTPSVEAAQYGTSMCVLALAILNGDMIPFAEQYASPQHAIPHAPEPDGKFWYASSRSLLPMRVEEALFYWTLDERNLRFPIGRHPRLPNVNVQRYGLETSGWLWIVDRCIRLPNFTRRHQALLNWTDFGSSVCSDEKLRHRLYLLFLDLIAVMRGKGFSLLVESILITLGFDSTRRNHVQDFSWAAMEATGDPICLTGADDHASFGQKLGSYSFTLLDRPFSEIKWLVDFAQRIVARGEFWCARLHGFTAPMAVFDCEEAKAIFTTTDVNIDVLKRASAPVGLLNVISVEVAKVGEGSRAQRFQQLVYRGKWRHGIWYAPQDLRRRYEFPWS